MHSKLQELLINCFLDTITQLLENKKHGVSYK